MPRKIRNRGKLKLMDATSKISARVCAQIFACEICRLIAIKWILIAICAIDCWPSFFSRCCGCFYASILWSRVQKITFRFFSALTRTCHLHRDFTFPLGKISVSRRLVCLVCTMEHNGVPLWLVGMYFLCEREVDDTSIWMGNDSQSAKHCQWLWHLFWTIAHVDIQWIRCCDLRMMFA